MPRPFAKWGTRVRSLTRCAASAVLALPCVVKTAFIGSGNCISAEFADVPCECLRSLLCFELRGPQWWGRHVPLCGEEVYGRANQSRPVSRVGNGPWEAAGSPVGYQWFPSTNELCAGCRRNTLGSAPAVSPGSQSALRPPFPQPQVELEVADSCLMLAPWFSSSFSEILLSKFVSEVLLCSFCFLNSLCQKVVCGKENSFCFA